MSRRLPTTKNFVSGERTPKATLNENYKNLNIAWRFGKVDLESKWGYEAINGKLKFDYSDALLEKIVDLELTNLDAKLTSINGELFNNHSDFLESLEINSSEFVDSNILSALMNNLSNSVFFEKIYKPIKNIEQMSWNDIERACHGKRGSSNSHFIKLSDLPRKAQKRLNELGYIDVDEIYSLRLGGKFRIYGLRKFNCLEIIWIDLEHEIWYDK